MNPKNMWYTRSQEELLELFAHDQFVVWLCNCARTIIIQAKQYGPWQWFVHELCDMANQYLAVDTEAQMEYAEYFLNPPYQRGGTLRPNDLKHMPPGWREISLLKASAHEEMTAQAWSEAPFRHPLYLVHNFARACAAHPQLHHKAQRLKILQQLRQTICNGFIQHKLCRPPLLEPGEMPGIRDLAEGPFCMRHYYVAPCANNACPDQRGYAKHTHFIPWDWAFWMEPEVHFPAIHTRTEGRAFLAQHFPDGTIGKLSFTELEIGLEQSGLSD